jgi:hypothetical protein
LTPLPAKRLDPLYGKGYNELEYSVIKPLWISRFFLSLRYTGAFLSCRNIENGERAAFLVD